MKNFRLFNVHCRNRFHNVFQRQLLSTQHLKTDKVLVVSKLSRFEFEKKKAKTLTESKLIDKLRQRGTDIEKMIRHHDLHKKFEENVVNTFSNLGISVKVVNRYDYTADDVVKSDIIIPIGGDGTFLLAASMVNNNEKPVIGLNSDPNRSEGYLCLPKKYSTNIREVIERLHNGNFKWLMRSRIRTTLLVSGKDNFVPKYMHDNDFEMFPKKSAAGTSSIDGAKVLPFLALNEVFMGETCSARVSHLQMRLNGSTENTNLKCSGVCVCTGTGSTSWHLSINRLPVQNVAELLRLIDIEATEGKDSLATVLGDIYNKNLIFDPADKRMAYTIRELISASVWPDPKGIKSRGFAQKIEIKSNCFDASLVIDGGVSFSFNDGTTALLEIRPEDALRTVIFKD
ncbi:NAD kinase 2, mitochondrial isoform X2 [Anthonomus grandis grandis]|uniref:NAD kinase 2, mitochondrial isoform X2 n=1 Tax=Anthonomus grandis grandis TaxID=2921223 RepID=UPI002165AF1F|nr:NAD kinase 2, mitochondrial isoform X2 [Anthonomus grandis grandis]